MSDHKQKYEDWLKDPYISDEDKEELRSIAGDEKEIEDRFYKDLEFGTGGLRGIIGNGTNRINVYTIRKATQGLANYINKKSGAGKGVSIAYDSRRFSERFAREAAAVLNGNGIKTFLFSTLTATPELSFAVRQTGSIAGIVITASHNPPEYNGYKVYWEDGAQVTPPHDTEIIEEVGRVESLADIKLMDETRARVEGLFNIIGYEMDDRYIAAMRRVSLDDGAIERVADDFRIVYTPFNGTGNVPVRRILAELGFKHVYVVEAQEAPDPDFTTLEYPNPEDPKAYTLALELAREKNADVVLATDPDADRLGIYAYDTAADEYVPFTGNMSAMIIAEYLLSVRKEKGTLHEKGSEAEKESGLTGMLISTIVSTNMAKALAKSYNIDFMEVLTGFKYIGEQIKLFEQRKNYFYEFGFEESYGCLAGVHARDKDAPIAVMLLCEAAAYYKDKGISLVEQMDNIYKKYGYYKEEQRSVTLKGVDGAREIAAIMERLRKDPPASFGEYRVLKIRDYKCNKVFAPGSDETSLTGLPSSNVLYFELADDAWVCARPSGTEPKIKFYIGVKGESKEDSRERLEKLKTALLESVGQGC